MNTASIVELVNVMKSSAYPNEVRVAAAVGLGEAGSHNVDKDLISVMKSTAYPDEVRAAAATALGKANKAR